MLMKITTLLCFGLFAVVSCKKSIPETCNDGIQNQDEVYADCGGSCSACPVEYPVNGMIGQNILHGDEDSTNLVASNYAFKASVPQGSSLSIVVTSLSGDFWLYGTNNGWEISTPTTNQSFDVISSGTADLIFSLAGTSGSALIEFYENGGVVTKQKVITWS